METPPNELTTSTAAVLAFIRENESVYEWRKCLQAERDRHAGDEERARASFRLALKYGVRWYLNQEARTAIEREAYASLVGAVDWPAVSTTIADEYDKAESTVPDDEDPERWDGKA